MGRHIAAFPERILKGWEAAGELALPGGYRGVTRVLVQGMGGSAIAGDIAGEALDGLTMDASGAAPRVDVHRDYGAHPAAGPGTLVIALSHSGRTEEALSGVEASLERGARLIAMTGGGPLARAAARHDLPVIGMPRTGGPPRAFLPYALGALLRLLCDLCVPSAAAFAGAALQSAVEELRQAQADFAPSCRRSNPAKELARALAGRVPVIVSSRGLVSAARRWKTQINENAKTPAWTEELPEMHHNAVVGFEQPRLRENLSVVLLGPPAPDDDGPARERYVISRDVFSRLNTPAHWPTLRGGTRLSRLLEAVLLGDYVSYYLALVNGVDPMPTETLDRVKDRIRGAAAVVDGHAE